MTERVETEEYTCGYCSKTVYTFWAYDETRCLGFKADSSYVLIGDVFFHSECWDKQIKEHPP